MCCVCSLVVQFMFTACNFLQKLSRIFACHKSSSVSRCSVFKNLRAQFLQYFSESNRLARGYDIELVLRKMVEIFGIPGFVIKYNVKLSLVNTPLRDSIQKNPVKIKIRRRSSNLWSIHTFCCTFVFFLQKIYMRSCTKKKFRFCSYLVIFLRIFTELCIYFNIVY